MEILLFVLLGVGAVAAVVGGIRVSRLGGEPEAHIDPATPKALPDLEKVVDALSEAPGPAMGYRIRHATARSALVTVPVLSAPLRHRGTGQLTPYACPTCRTAHPVKTMHLWLDDAGAVLVSKQVLEYLRKAGLENYDLTYEGTVTKPPPLRMGPGVRRDQIDQANRKIIRYKVV